MLLFYITYINPESVTLNIPFITLRMVKYRITKNQNLETVNPDLAGNF